MNDFENKTGNTKLDLEIDACNKIFFYIYTVYIKGESKFVELKWWLQLFVSIEYAFRWYIFDRIRFCVC